MFDRFTRTLAAWRNQQQTADELNRLSDAQLADIGLTRDQIPDIVRNAGERDW